MTAPLDDATTSPVARVAPIPRVSSTGEVAQRLLEYVRAADLGAGSRLPPERQLAADLGVPRSAVREALAALDLLGVIVSRQGSGNYLNDGPSELLPQAIEWGLMLGQRRTLDLAETRRTIEVAVAELAAQRRTSSDAERLHEAFDAMVRARDRPQELLEADVAFHLQIAIVARNTVLSDLLQSVQSLLRVWIRRGLSRDADHADSTIEEHRAIVAAIEAGDSAAARSAMSRHMESAAARLAQSLQP